MIKILIINRSKHVTNDILKSIVKAIDMLGKIMAKSWHVMFPEIEIATSAENGQWNFFIVDETYDNDGNVLAYHMDQNNNISGIIYAGRILRDGGCVVNAYDNVKSDGKPDIIYDNKAQALFKKCTSISRALCHEIFETIIDPSCNSLWNTGSINMFGYGMSYVAEVCDPVEDNNVVVHCDGFDIYLSDFVYPAWKDRTNSQGPFNFRDTLSKPFSIDDGGYITTSDDRIITAMKKKPNFKHKVRYQKRMYKYESTKSICLY